MKRALMYASVASMIQQFNMNNIILLQELGYEVDVACNFNFGSSISQEKIEQLKIDLSKMNVSFCNIPIPRKIHDLKNIKVSYNETKKLMDKNCYDIIHCHSPIGGIICRFANRYSINYNNTRMIYTAHGFHFYKGNSFLKNFIFRTIEKIGAKYTNVLITINKEDYNAAKKFKLRNNGEVIYVPGVGIDERKINSIQGDKEGLCNELGISSNSKLLLSVGEINDNKNHKVIIESLPDLPKDVHYIICGQGYLKTDHIVLAKKIGVDDRVHFLGFRNDAIKVMKSCDIFVFPSKREGLSVALMEAMACGLPCIASKIRGNVDLIDGDNGILVDLNINDWSESIKSFLSMKKTNIDMKEYTKDHIYKKMKSIYTKGD